MALTKTDIDRYRDVLLAERERLAEAVDSLQGSDARVSDETEENGLENHMADLASDTYRREMEATLEGHEQGLLTEVDAALERIEQGTYGKCVDCDVAIPAERLEALPYTRRCVDCASRNQG